MVVLLESINLHTVLESICLSQQIKVHNYFTQHICTTIQTHYAFYYAGIFDTGLNCTCWIAVTHCLYQYM